MQFPFKIEWTFVSVDREIILSYTPFKIEWRVITLKKNYCFYCEPEEFDYLKRCLRNYRNERDDETDFHSKLNGKDSIKLDLILDAVEYLVVRGNE